MKLTTARLTIDPLGVADIAEFVAYRVTVTVTVGFGRECRQVDAEWFKQEWVTLDNWVLARPVETASRVAGPG